MLIWLVRKQQPSLFSFLIATCFVGSFLLLIFISARWDITGFWLRYIWIVLFIVAFAIGFSKHRNRPFFAHTSLLQTTLKSVQVVLIFLIMFSIWQMRSNAAFKSEAVELAMPLKGVTWYVIHGGSNAFMNPHRHVRAQEYAVDITILNSLSQRAIGLIPTDLTRYSAFGIEVTAPCDGRVIAMESNLPDQTPLQMDSANLAGNYVTIACKGVVVMLAHLKRGSVAVTLGSEIQTGGRIGEIGNSGNTTEPHLHIHAVRQPPQAAQKLEEVLFSGEPVPMTFDNEFLTRNNFGTSKQTFSR